MAKRKDGEGTFGKKTVKGNSYHFFRDADGKYIYARSLKELRRKVRESESQKKVKKTKETFSEYCVSWLKTRRGIISDGVYDDYESVINNRIKKYLIGDMLPSEITVDIINNHLKKLAEKYSKGSINKTWVVIRQVIEYGQEEGKIQEFSFKKIIKPSEDNCAVKKKDVPFIDEHDMDILYEEAYTGKYGNAANMIVFIMYTGLRIAEAIALKWKDVEPDFSRIKVRSSSRRNIIRDENLDPVKNDKGKNTYEKVIKVPKTKDSYRTIPLPQRAREVVGFASVNSKGPDSYVFTTSNGTQYERRTVERTLQFMMKNSKCRRKDYTPHSLRHGYGSVLISKGVDIKIVSELLGHTDVAFTYNTYIGILREDKINAVKVFD